MSDSSDPTTRAAVADPTGFTRVPTGRPAWPIVLVDGGPDCGVAELVYRLSASPRIGRTFVFEVGERDADAFVTLGPYEIVVLAGSWTDYIDKLRWAANQPMVDGLPNAIIINSVSRVWNDLKDWASHRARNSRRARDILRVDPDADIEVTSNYWNDAKSRWNSQINVLNKFAGVSILVARGQEVTAFENGQPVNGLTVWSIDAEKNTRFNVTANVSVRTPGDARLMAAKNPGLTIPNGGLPLDGPDAIEHVIFQLLASGDPQINQPVGAAPGIPIAQAKKDVMGVYQRAQFNDDDAQAAAKALWLREGGPNGHDAEVSRDFVNRLVGLAAADIENPVPPTVEPPAMDIAPVTNNSPQTTEPPADADDGPPPSIDAIPGVTRGVGNLTGRWLVEYEGETVCDVEGNYDEAQAERTRWISQRDPDEGIEPNGVTIRPWVADDDLIDSTADATDTLADTTPV